MKIKKERFNVTGMTCSACSSRVEKNIAKLEGVEHVSVNLLTNSMQVEYDQEKINDQDIINKVVDTGYGAELIGKHSEQQAKNKDHNSKNETDGTNAQRNTKVSGNKRNTEIEGMKHRFIWSLIFLIPMMIISMGEMFCHMTGLAVPEIMNELFYGNKNALTFAFTQFLLVLPIIYLNQHYYKRGFKNLFHGSPNMDTL